MHYFSSAALTARSSAKLFSPAPAISTPFGKPGVSGRRESQHTTPRVTT